MKLNLIYLPFLLAFISFTSSAQIIKEYSYGVVDNFQPYSLSTGQVVYAYQDLVNYQVKVYNSDHSLYKTIAIPRVDGHRFFHIFFVSDKLFDLTPDLEVFVIYARDGAPAYKSKIIIETGQELMTFEGAGPVPEIFNTPEGTKLKIVVHLEAYRLQTEIYSLPGRTPLQVTLEERATEALTPYPNPTTGTNNINLPYKVTPGEQAQLSIYNMQGGPVKTYTVDSTFDHLLLDTSQFPRGTYLYKVSIKGKLSSGSKFVVR